MALAHKRSPAAVAEAQARQEKAAATKGAMVSLEQYAAIKNPNSKQVEQAINLLASAQADLIRAVIGA